MQRQPARALRTTRHRDKLRYLLAEDTVLLVDESSMIPIPNLVALAEARNAKMVLAGDTGQLHRTPRLTATRTYHASRCAGVTGFRYCCSRHDRTTPTAGGIRGCLAIALPAGLPKVRSDRGCLGRRSRRAWPGWCPAVAWVIGARQEVRIVPALDGAGHVLPRDVCRRAIAAVSRHARRHSLGGRQVSGVAGPHSVPVQGACLGALAGGTGPSGSFGGRCG